MASTHEASRPEAGIEINLCVYREPHPVCRKVGLDGFRPESW